TTREGNGARLTNLSHDEHSLAPILFDGDGDLGIAEVPVGEFGPELTLERSERQSSGFHATHQRERERSVGFDGVLSAEIRLIEDLNRQNILRTDDVVDG